MHAKLPSLSTPPTAQQDVYKGFSSSSCPDVASTARKTVGVGGVMCCMPYPPSPPPAPPPPPPPPPPSRPSPPSPPHTPCYNCTFTLTTKTWASEISWSVDDTLVVSSGSFFNHGTYTKSACIDAGVRTPNMKDSFGNGWNGGSMDITGPSGTAILSGASISSGKTLDATFMVGGSSTRQPDAALIATKKALARGALQPFRISFLEAGELAPTAPNPNPDNPRTDDSSHSTSLDLTNSTDYGNLTQATPRNTTSAMPIPVDTDPDMDTDMTDGPVAVELSAEHRVEIIQFVSSTVRALLGDPCTRGNMPAPPPMPPPSPPEPPAAPSKLQNAMGACSAQCAGEESPY